jgi:hypothetical protein
MAIDSVGLCPRPPLTQLANTYFYHFYKNSNMKISRLEISSNVMCNNKSIFLEIDDEAQQAPPHASLSRFGCRSAGQPLNGCCFSYIMVWPYPNKVI